MEMIACGSFCGYELQKFLSVSIFHVEKVSRKHFEDGIYNFKDLEPTRKEKFALKPTLFDLSKHIGISKSL